MTFQTLQSTPKSFPPCQIRVGQPVHNGHSLSQPAETERLNLGGTTCRPKLASGTPTRSSPACDDFHNFQFVARVQLAPGKFRWCDCCAIVFHHDAARRKLLRDQKLLNRARQLRLDLFSVGNDEHKLCRQGRVPIFPHRLVAEFAD